MRRPFLLLSWICLGVVGASCSVSSVERVPPARTPSTTQPVADDESPEPRAAAESNLDGDVVYLDPTVLELGVIPPSSWTKFTLRIVNVSDAPVLLVKVVWRSGSGAFGFDKALSPRSAREVVIDLQAPPRPGIQFERPVTVIFGDRPPLVCKVRGRTEC